MADFNFDMTPHLVVTDGMAAMTFYVNALGFTEAVRMKTPDGKLLHGELRLGDHKIFIGEENSTAPAGCRSPKTLGGSSVTLNLRVPDVDASFTKVIAAGATVIMPPQDMFWGDRYCQLIDPFGHHWALATHKRDVTPQEMKKAMAEMFAKKN